MKNIRVPVEDYDMYKADAEKIMTYVKNRVFLKSDKTFEKAIH